MLDASLERVRLQRIELGLSMLATLLAAAGATAASVEVTVVASGVYVAIRPGTLDHPVEANVTFLVGPSDVVVVDTSRTPSSAREVIADPSRHAAPRTHHS